MDSELKKLLMAGWAAAALDAGAALGSGSCVGDSAMPRRLLRLESRRDDLRSAVGGAEPPLDERGVVLEGFLVLGMMDTLNTIVERAGSDERLWNGKVTLEENLPGPEQRKERRELLTEGGFITKRKTFC